MEDRPESVEITSVSDGNPWGGKPSNLESGGTILSGSVASLGTSNGGALGTVAHQEQGNTGVAGHGAGVIREQQEPIQSPSHKVQIASHKQHHTGHPMPWPSPMTSAQQGQ